MPYKNLYFEVRNMTKFLSPENLCTNFEGKGRNHYHSQFVRKILYYEVTALELSNLYSLYATNCHNSEVSENTWKCATVHKFPTYALQFPLLLGSRKFTAGLALFTYAHKASRCCKSKVLPVNEFPINEKQSE